MNASGRIFVTKPSSHMSGPSRPSGPDVPPDEPLTDAEAAEEAHARRRHRLERFLQVAVFCAIVGAWELSAQTGLADPFFFGKPSGIAATIWRWATRGTPQGPLLRQGAAAPAATLLTPGPAAPRDADAYRHGALLSGPPHAVPRGPHRGGARCPPTVRRRE